MDALDVGSKIIIKRKEYEVVEVISEHSYKVIYKDKYYMVKSLGFRTVAFSNFQYANKRFKATAVKIPEVKVIDKKTGYAVMNYIEGESLFTILAREDLSERILELLFEMNWQARVNHMLLDFNPHNFIYSEDKLYYMPFTFDVYTHDKDFTKTSINLFFYTSQFEEMLINEGLPLSPKRKKSEFESNKHIILTVCKYYK